MSQHEVRSFQFRKGVRVLESTVCDWVEMRRAGNELADDAGLVDLYCYNAPLRRWERMGTFHGGMRYTNLLGEQCIIRNDFSGLDFVNKDAKK